MYAKANIGLGLNAIVVKYTESNSVRELEKMLGETI
jgi:hypothetical protein